MKKFTFFAGAAILSCLFTAPSFGQGSCTDWENDYVEGKDNFPGINSYDLLTSGDQAAQTYFYSGEGTINAIRLHGYVPGSFVTWVPLRIRIYNVDANNRPTTPISDNIYVTYFDSPSNSNLIDIPNTFVDGNFAVAVQVWDNFRTFNCKTTEDGDGNGDDLASYRNNGFGSWNSVLDDVEDVDYYIEPLMSNTNNASFEVVNGNCHAVGNVTFNNTSTVCESPMFNQSSTIYTWNFGDATSSNLKNPVHTYAAGSYTVTLTTTHERFDGSTCTDVATAQITVGMTVAATVTDATCFGNEDGSVTPVVSNGTAPFETWTSGNGLDDLGAGNYILYAEDDLGCIASVGFTVDQDPEILLGTPAITSATCGNADGAILVNATGGTGTLEYSNNDGASYQSTGYFTGLEGGENTILVQDGNGCTTEKSFIIPETSAPSITLFSLTNVTCNGDGDGAILVTGTGGTGVIEFSIDGGDSFQSSGTFTGLDAGVYSVIVRDAIGCQNGISEIVVSEPGEINFDLSAEPTLCFGGNNGSIAVSNVIGGTGVFQYSIDGINYQSASTFNGLTAGNYLVRAKDVKGCIATQNIVVTQPTVLIASTTHTDPVCFEQANGSITVNVSGGVGNYSFDITGDGNEPQAFDTFYGIADGSYAIVVTDGNGCLINTSAVVTQPTVVTSTLVVGSSTCGGSDGSIGVTAPAGGSGSGYEYSSNDGLTWNSAPGTINGLSAGAYDVLIRDGAGCMVGYSADVTNIGVTPSLTVLNHSDVTCHGGNNGSITVNTGVATDEYSIGGAFQSSGVFTNLPAGTYNVVVKDVANCQLEAAVVTIIEPAAFVISTTPDAATCYGYADGSVEVMANGGAGTISYSIDGLSFQSGNVITGLAAGEYDLTIQDGVGCFGYSSFIVTQPTQVKGYYAQLDVTCFGADNGVIYASANGGTPTYQYSLDGVNFFNSGTFTGLDGGLYTVYYQDAQGCQVEHEVIVEEPWLLLINADVTDVSCAGGNNGVIDLSVTGGTPPYNFQWTTSDAIIISEDIFNLPEGSYEVDVMDANGCMSTGTYIVEAPANPLVINGTVTDASGATANDGAIDVTVTGGTSPYFYLWSNGSTTGDVTGLLPGVYTVEVTDATGCSVSNTFTIGNLLGITEATTYAISIYPNPARDILNITISDADVVSVKMMNLQGQVVYSDYSGDIQTIISLDDFSTGIYFVSVHTNKGVSTEKVVITK